MNLSSNSLHSFIHDSEEVPKPKNYLSFEELVSNYSLHFLLSKLLKHKMLQFAPLQIDIASPVEKNRLRFKATLDYDKFLVIKIPL